MGPHRPERLSSERQAMQAELLAMVLKLEEQARRLFMSKPHARDMIASMPPIDLPLRLEFTGRPGSEREEAARLLDSIEAHLDDAILAGCAFRPGRVHCFFCESSECEHARPPEPRHVFKGYSQLGQPLWWSLLDLAIARGDESVDQIAEERGLPSKIAVGRDDLVRDRMPVFAQREHAYDLRGQVCMGYYHEGRGGAASKFAVTMQIIRSSTRAKVVRLGINTVGRLPSGADVESLLLGDARWPFADLLVAADRELASINQELKQLDKSKRLARAAEAADELLAGLEHGVARRQRREGWRTGHAVQRAEEKTRPTGMARQDLQTARHDRVLFDKLKQTFVVLGGKGRTHIFSPEGLHVTSLHLEKKDIEDRLAKGRWAVLEKADVESILAKARAAYAKAAGTEGAPKGPAVAPSAPSSVAAPTSLPSQQKAAPLPEPPAA